MHEFEGHGEMGDQMQLRIGTADLARARVKNYFQELREQLSLQETAALAIVETHIREKMCSLRQQEEDLTTLLSQVFNCI